MNAPDIVAALEPVVRAFEALSVPYQVGGSVASSAQGVARATLDVDVVADLRPEQVPAFAARLRPDYYVDEDMAREAIGRRAAFNVVHLETMLKVDVFALRDREYDRVAFSRAREDTLEAGDGARRFAFASPEDVVLNKLEWYEQGGRVSDRQWNDAVGVLKVQADALDRAYLRDWASRLGLTELLARALEEAGDPGEGPA